MALYNYVYYYYYYYYFVAHQHKAAGRKTRLDMQNYVATAIFPVTMVLWKETAFPLCRAIKRRWAQCDILLNCAL